MWKRTREEAREYWAQLCSLNMRQQHMLSLDDEFPKVGMFEPTCISAEIRPGWQHILRPVLAILQHYGCTVGQIKSKFCVLVVYWDDPPGPESEDPSVAEILPTLSYQARREIETVVSTAAEISSWSCEDCGRYVAAGGGQPMSGVRLCETCRKAPGW